jgi:succinate dehydrogenase / fumarate reductase, membrane anchor subunit
MNVAGASLSDAGARREAAARARFERWSWYFFRISGLALVVLALGHVLIMHVINSVDVISYSFVAERWRSIGWRIYDWLLLVLALSHGMNGLRLVVDDYARGNVRRLLLGASAALYATLMIAGTITILTFPR